MLFRRSSGRSAGAARMTATAFRDDRSAVLVVITGLLFDQCKLHSSAAFQIGERLRLHVPGQGLIEAEVKCTADGEASVVFTTACHV